MLGKRVNLKVSSNGAIHATFGLDTEQSVSSWQFISYVYAKDAPSVALDTMTCTLDSTERTVTVTMEADDVAALLADGQTTASLGWCLLCRPNTTTGRQFFYGDLDISEGGPAWAA
jgi:hypothetical protein